MTCLGLLSIKYLTEDMSWSSTHRRHFYVFYPQKTSLEYLHWTSIGLQRTFIHIKIVLVPWVELYSIEKNFLDPEVELFFKEQNFLDLRSLSTDFRRTFAQRKFFSIKKILWNSELTFFSIELLFWVRELKKERERENSSGHQC